MIQSLGRALVPVLAMSMALAPFCAAAGEPDEPTAARVRAAIEEYVEQDVELKGKFLIVDPRSDAPLALTYNHVHSEVHSHEKDHVAYIDFTDSAGVVYDVNVVVGVSSEESEIREVFLHKVSGQAIPQDGNGGR